MSLLPIAGKQPGGHRHGTLLLGHEDVVGAAANAAIVHHHHVVGKRRRLRHILHRLFRQRRLVSCGFCRGWGVSSFAP